MQATLVYRTLLVEDYRGVLQDNLKQGFPTGRLDVNMACVVSGLSCFVVVVLI